MAAEAAATVAASPVATEPAEPPASGMLVRSGGGSRPYSACTRSQPAQRGKIGDGVALGKGAAPCQRPASTTKTMSTTINYPGYAPTAQLLTTHARNVGKRQKTCHGGKDANATLTSALRRYRA